MLGMGPGPHLRPCRSAQAVVTAKGGCILAIPLGEMGRSWLLFVLPQAITGPWGSVETKPWNILEPSNMETGEPWKPPYIVEVLRKAMRTVKLWKPWKPQRRNNHHRGKAMETVENMALETISCSTWQLCPCPCCPCPPCSTDLYSSSLPLRPTSPTCLHISRPFFSWCLRFLPGFALVVFMEYMEPMQTRKTWKPGDHGETWRNCGIFLGTKHRKHGNQKPGRHHRNPPIPYSPFPHAPLPCLADLQARPTAQKEHAIQGLADQLPRKWHWEALSVQPPVWWFGSKKTCKVWTSLQLQPPEGKNKEIFETEMVSLGANRVAFLRPRKNCLQSWQRLTTFPTSGPWLAWDVRFPEKLIKLQKMARNKETQWKSSGANRLPLKKYAVMRLRQWARSGPRQQIR